METRICGKTVAELIKRQPVLADVLNKKPTLWLNPNSIPFQKVESTLEFTREHVEDAARRLERFRPYIALAFPETTQTQGIIESPLQRIPAMHQSLNTYYNTIITGNLYVKLDSHLPISGSIKARGGIYEILKFAETTAIENGLLKLTDNYVSIATAPFYQLFSKYSIVVGSTGNLGLSIGIISAKLGFGVTVHMSSDAKQWKKDMLRDKGVRVVEHDADYSVAVAEGREQAKQNPHCHFVDDEDSQDLFLGYAVAAQRLKVQLQEQSIPVDKNHPLYVYLPCGVGGGPGGITLGLKFVFGDNVHCFFAEPTQSPAMLVGLSTDLHDSISAKQLGIENTTIADGLAVSRPSGRVCRAMKHLLSGIFTVNDEEMSALLAILAQSENIHLEPSAVIGFSGCARIFDNSEYTGISNTANQHTTHVVWATGGSMVPESVWLEYLHEGKRQLQNRKTIGFNY
ncbi:D-serine ammonia-lyase [Desulfosediminicola flagellatus]|uniref:D-serine ammonia-lyase n=1 Tax=Desulfosediminicola flagellatus TaxID=2569541 RepID=UPI0010AD700C|nr:D-serine ammonia-lyase [Desulfosediminicola flagellatus]